MRSSSTRRACGSCRTCGKRTERVSHKVLGRRTERAAHTLHKASLFSFTKKEKGKNPCIAVAPYSILTASPEWPVFKRSSVAAFQRSVTKYSSILRPGSTLATGVPEAPGTGILTGVLKFIEEATFVAIDGSANGVPGSRLQGSSRSLPS
jgi:hypothetical protein